MPYSYKFRGRRIADNHFVYGDLTHVNTECFIGDWKVFSDSVALLVGYDCNDDEVYSDDALVDFSMKESAQVVFTPNLRVEILGYSDKITSHKLGDHFDYTVKENL